MPVYNGANTIELAIKSLLLQTYSNWNCVIVNDGSNDNTKAILDNLKDERFKIIHLEKNRGRGYARQVCLENAFGDFLTFLDADDFLHSQKIEKQVSVFISNPEIKLVSCGQGSFDNNNNLKSIRGIKNKGKIKYRIGDEVIFIPVTTMIYLNESTSIKYNNKLNASEDVDFLSRYLDNKYFYNINEVYYYYYEYESVSYFKTLEYSYYKLIRITLMFKREAYKSIILFIKTMLKTVAYMIFIPILGKEFFIKRRGYSPSENQVVEFNQQLAVLFNKP
jgi:glycosyltransferase involved in cell wall biosynthesis